MTDDRQDVPHRSPYSGFKRILASEEWFEVYEITSDLYAFCEPRHYEDTTIHLVIGQDRAALIDSGCGIGNLRRVVEQVTAKPVVVINTHTHTDHLGSNGQFSEIAMYDHPLARQVAANGVSHATMQAELLAENLVMKPWPKGVNPSGLSVPPFKVSRWLTDGDRIDLGGRVLEVIHTPGEAADHICLLDRTGRVLFCGDLLLQGPVWTHLEGGSVSDLISSYRRLMSYLPEFDRLMPGHNEPFLDKGLLPESLAGAEKVASGDAEYQEIVDPWNRSLRRFVLGRFEILTRAGGEAHG